MDTMIRIEGIKKTYGSRTVLEIHQLSINRAGPVLLRGGNGSGKSTLLRLLAGVTRPNAGRIEYHEDLKSGTLGYLPQRGGLYDDLTVIENLILRRRLHGKPDSSCDDKWYVDEMGLGPFLQSRVAELSGGFRRLTAIAALFHAQPSWILMDEPLTGIDTARRVLLKERISKASDEMQLLVVAAPTTSGSIDAESVVEMRNGRPLS